MIDILAYQDRLKIKTENGKKFVHCLIRKRWMVLQPEELVRQLFLHYLISDRAFSADKIAVEKGMKVNNRTRRFDILIYDKEISPYILVECKAPHIPISQDVMDQIGQYNLPLKAEFLLLTNGKMTICCQLSDNREQYEFLSELPKRTPR